MIKFQEIILKLYDIMTCLLKHTSMHIDNKFSKTITSKFFSFSMYEISLTLISFYGVSFSVAKINSLACFIDL